MSPKFIKENRDIQSPRANKILTRLRQRGRSCGVQGIDPASGGNAAAEDAGVKDFARPHKTLAKRYPRTPAMAADLANHIWTVEEIVNLVKAV